MKINVWWTILIGLVFSAIFSVVFYNKGYNDGYQESKQWANHSERLTLLHVGTHAPFIYWNKYDECSYFVKRIWWAEEIPFYLDAYNKHQESLKVSK